MGDIPSFLDLVLWAILVATATFIGDRIWNEED